MRSTRRIPSGVTFVVCVVLWLLSLGALTPAVHVVRAAGAWYVAATGSDGPGCGGSSNPCRTINRILTSTPGFAPGDTVNVSGVLSESLTVTKSVFIVGKTPDAALQTNGASRVLRVSSGISVTLNDLTISNGGSADGGGILNEGALTAANVAVTGNRATNSGAGIYNLGVLTMTQSTIASNRITGIGGAGGGIENTGASAALFLTDTAVEANNGGTYGGGIDNFGGAMRLSRVVIRDNVAASGAGIYNDNLANIENAAVVQNQQGGGIANIGSLILKNTTVSGNTLLNGPGAGIENTTSNARASLSFVSIVSNTITNTSSLDASALHVGVGARAEMTGTVIAYNSAKNCYSDSGVFQSFNYNVSSDSTCTFLTQPNDASTTDPKMSSLQFSNGTYTHAPMRGSPLLDVVNGSPCPPQDQRGVSRPQGPKCEIGAYEVAAVDLAVAASAEPPTLLAGASLAYSVEVTNNAGFSATDVRVTSTLPASVSFNACTLSQGWCDVNAGQVNAAFGTVPGGQKVIMTLWVTPTTPSLVSAQFVASSNEPDSAPDNDAASAEANVEPSADLVISDSAPSVVSPRAVYSLTVQVTNAGPTPAQSPVVTTTLSSGAQFLDASGAGANWSCKLLGSAVTCNYQLAQLAVGAAPPIVIGVMAPGTRTSLIATSIVSTLSPDPNLTNNTATASTAVSTYAVYTPIVVR